MYRQLSGLYAITDETLMPGEQLLRKVEAALRGGCRIVQYRDKRGSHPERAQQARQLVELCRQFQAILIINDDVDLAISVAADGVHLGQTDTAIEIAGQQLRGKGLIGATCHSSIDLAIKAVNNGASYVAFGRFFPSNTKASASPADIDILATAKTRIELPVVAIGGITVDNAPSLLAQGVDCVAVSYDLFHHDDLTLIQQRAEQYSRLFTKLA